MPAPKDPSYEAYSENLSWCKLDPDESGKSLPVVGKKKQVIFTAQKEDRAVMQGCSGAMLKDRAGFCTK